MTGLKFLVILEDNSETPHVVSYFLQVLMTATFTPLPCYLLRTGIKNIA